MLCCIRIHWADPEFSVVNNDTRFWVKSIEWYFEQQKEARFYWAYKPLPSFFLYSSFISCSFVLRHKKSSCIEDETSQELLTTSYSYATNIQHFTTTPNASPRTC